jgi:hypothetical protein
VIIVFLGLSALSLSPVLTLNPAIAPAYAQQKLQGGGQGSGSGGTTNGSAGALGSGSGGATAGASKGSSTVSGSATGTGPGGTNQNRAGSAAAAQPPGPVVPPVDEDTITAILDKLQGSVQGGESVSFPDRCAYAAPGRLTSDARLSGQNLDQLVAAQYVLAPNFDPGEARTAVILLANYQEELEKREPDALVAATYLAMTATRPVTAEAVGRVNALLCVTSTRSLADQIAITAEDERQALTTQATN